MSVLYDNACLEIESSQAACCKFISANDLGLTGGHQSGYYIPNNAAKLLFDCDCRKGGNVKRDVMLYWNCEIWTDSVFTYYGKGTRNESRITSFGRGFEYMNESYLGSLLIICRRYDYEYACFVLSSGDDIDNFLVRYSISPASRCTIIDSNTAPSSEERLQSSLEEAIAPLSTFPATIKMALLAQHCYNKAFGVTNSKIISSPDTIIKEWIDTESSLFYRLEEKVYGERYKIPFSNCKELIAFSNEILNRRKARAGKSLEHHLAEKFRCNRLKFDEQCVTEDNKKPDFLFPGADEYKDFSFPAEDLTLLGAKTTCKDRWRQVLTEGNRVNEKYLFTLQQGISSQQLTEMRHENLKLVVPKGNLSCFARHDVPYLMTLGQFIVLVKEKQEKHGISVLF